MRVRDVAAMRAERSHLLAACPASSSRVVGTELLPDAPHSSSLAVLALFALYLTLHEATVMAERSSTPPPLFL
jgi:hypothetical protein